MLGRLTWTLAGCCVVAACSGSSKEFTSGPPGRNGSGAAAGEADAGTGATGGAAGKGGTGGGSAGKGGAAGMATGGAGMATGGSAGAGGSTSGSGGVAADDAPVVVAVDLCDKIFECCSAAELMNLSLLGQSKSSCELTVTAYLGLLLKAADPSLAAGRLVYDGNALQACLDDYQNRTCGMLRGLDGFDCPGLLVPEVNLGDACGLNAECVDGYCDGSADATNPVGQCVPKKQNGADCADNAECVSGTCDGASCTDTVPTPLCGG